MNRSRSRRRVLFVIGTRPEAIKLAPVIAACRRAESLEVRVCVTAQHRQILDPFLEEFGINADVDLDVMRDDQVPSEVMARVLDRLDSVLVEERPDLVVVQGDTTTTLAAALAAFHRRVSVAHVEAGLRTFDPLVPWPEEMNRRLVSRLASWHFAPTASARRNLIRERVNADRILVTGNPGVDALLQALRQRRRPLKVPDILDESRGVKARRLVLVTMHRRENVPSGLEEVGHALLDILDQIPDISVVMPVHPNPRVRATVEQVFSEARRAGGRIRLLPPLPYSDFVSLLACCHLVITDSGGVQEEAPVLGKPVLCAREVTERPEGVQAGAVRLVGTNRARIVENAMRLLTDPLAYRRMARRRLLYGDGRASRRIVRALLAP